MSRECAEPRRNLCNLEHERAGGRRRAGRSLPGRLTERWSHCERCSFPCPLLACWPWRRHHHGARVLVVRCVALHFQLADADAAACCYYVSATGGTGHFFPSLVRHETRRAQCFGWYDDHDGLTSPAKAAAAAAAALRAPCTDGGYLSPRPLLPPPPPPPFARRRTLLTDLPGNPRRPAEGANQIYHGHRRWPI